MIDIPNSASINAVADWIELSISTSKDFVSKAAVTTAIERAAGKEPSESFVSTVWFELEARQRLYSVPMFTVQDRTIEPTAESQPSPEYLACLLLSLFGVQGNTQRPAKLFERLTCEAVKKYLSGKAIVFGWPFNGEDQADENTDEYLLKRAVKKMAEVLLERFIEAPDSRFKDRGVDVIGWLPSQEQRSGQVIILLQCAAGHNWVDKRPVPIKAWTQYLHWACDPITAFAVPCVVNSREWHDKSREHGILFDRIRLINLLSDGGDDKELRQELNAWVEEQLADFNE